MFFFIYLTFFYMELSKSQTQKSIYDYLVWMTDELVDKFKVYRD